MTAHTSSGSLNGRFAGVEHVPIVIVGAGFAGIGMSVALAKLGLEHVIFERAPEVGGTWWANTYPGARCDVPSHLYSFSFAPNPDWSHSYSAQPEILEYLVRCADRFGVRERVRFSTEVLTASWDEERTVWEIETSAGGFTAGVMIMASGPLSQPSVPSLPGLENFARTAFHSGAWDHSHDLKGKRVAVVGTGASAIQIVPSIQPVVEQMYVFQRTPPWVLPHPGRGIDERNRRIYRRFPLVQLAKRLCIYSASELLILGLAKRPALMRIIARLGRTHLLRQVRDRELRRRLTPDYLPGCKRLLISNTYYPAICADNTELVTDQIDRISAASITTTSGASFEVDTIILATGFSVTDPPIGRMISGADGRTLRDTWLAGGMGAYRGTTMPNFPNMFVLAGPNTGIGHTSLIVMIEAQTSHVAECLRYAKTHGLGRIEVKQEPFERYNADVQRRVSRSVWNTGGCASWYLDAHGRNTTLWPDFSFKFVRATKHFDPSAYDIRPARRVSAAAPDSPDGAAELVTAGSGVFKRSSAGVASL